MSIPSISATIRATPTSNVSADTKAQSTSTNTIASTRDSTSVTVASQLQSQTAGLKKTSANISQALSVAEVADSGAEEIQNTLSDLQSLAGQAQSTTLTASESSTVNQEFQDGLKKIDQIANNTSFGGKKLLDGSLSETDSLSIDSAVTPAGEHQTFSIPNFTTSSLFAGASLDVSTPTGAQAALSSINSALSEVADTRATIGGFTQSVDVAFAKVETAITNIDASVATLTEADIAATSSTSLVDILQNPGQNANALLAQGNRLGASILQLIG